MGMQMGSSMAASIRQRRNAQMMYEIRSRLQKERLDGQLANQTALANTRAGLSGRGAVPATDAIPTAPAVPYTPQESLAAVNASRQAAGLPPVGTGQVALPAPPQAGGATRPGLPAKAGSAPLQLGAPGPTFDIVARPSKDGKTFQPQITTKGVTQDQLPDIMSKLSAFNKQQRVSDDASDSIDQQVTNLQKDKAASIANPGDNGRTWSEWWNNKGADSHVADDDQKISALNAMKNGGAPASTPPAGTPPAASSILTGQPPVDMGHSTAPPDASLSAGGTPGGSLPPTAPAIPPEAISYLQQNPHLASDFDNKYGAGLSDQYLKVDQPAPGSDLPLPAASDMISSPTSFSGADEDEFSGADGE